MISARADTLEAGCSRLRNMGLAQRHFRSGALVAAYALAGLCLAHSGTVLAQSSKPDAGGAVQASKPIRTETRTFENWSVTCEEFARQPGKSVCSAVLKIVDPKSGRVLFAWLLARQVKTGQIIGLFQTPTGVLVEPGITFQFADGKPRKFGYTSCEQGRCSTVVPMGLSIRKEIGRAKAGKITIVSTTGQRIHFQVAPAGFASAYAAVLAVK